MVHHILVLLLRHGIGEVLVDIVNELGAEVYLPPLSLCGDNAAMIGAQGYYEYLSGNTADESLNATATLPIDYR